MQNRTYPLRPTSLTSKRRVISVTEELKATHGSVSVSRHTGHGLSRMTPELLVDIVNGTAQSNASSLRRPGSVDSDDDAADPFSMNSTHSPATMDSTVSDVKLPRSSDATKVGAENSTTNLQSASQGPVVDISRYADDTLTESVPSRVAVPLSVRSLPFVTQPVESGPLAGLRYPRPVTDGFGRMDHSIMTLISRLPESATLDEKFDLIAKWIDSYHVDVIPHRIAKQLKAMLSFGEVTIPEAGAGVSRKVSVSPVRNLAARLSSASSMDQNGTGLNASQNDEFGTFNLLGLRGRGSQAGLAPTAAIATCYALHQLLLVTARTIPILGPVVQAVLHGTLELIFVEPPTNLSPVLIDVSLSERSLREHLSQFRGSMHYQHAKDLHRKLAALHRFAAQSESMRRNYKDVLGNIDRRVQRGTMRAVLKSWRAVAVQSKRELQHKKEIEALEAKVAAAKAEAAQCQAIVAQCKAELAANLHTTAVFKEETDITIKALQYDVMQYKAEIAKFDITAQDLKDQLAVARKKIVEVDFEWQRRYREVVESVKDFSHRLLNPSAGLSSFVRDVVHTYSPIVLDAADSDDDDAAAALRKKEELKAGGRRANVAPPVFSEATLVQWAQAMLASPQSPWTTDKDVRRERLEQGRPLPAALPKLLALEGGAAGLDNTGALIHVLFPLELTLENLQARVLTVSPSEKASYLLKWFRSHKVPGVPPALEEDDLAGADAVGAAGVGSLMTALFNVCCDPLGQLRCAQSTLPFYDAPTRKNRPDLKAAAELPSAATNPSTNSGVADQTQEPTTPTLTLPTITCHDDELHFPTDPYQTKQQLSDDLHRLEVRYTQRLNVLSQSQGNALGLLISAASKLKNKGTVEKQLTTEEQQDQAAFTIGYHHASEYCSRLEFETISTLLTKHYVVLRKLFLFYSANKTATGSQISIPQFLRLLRDARLVPSGGSITSHSSGTVLGHNTSNQPAALDASAVMKVLPQVPSLEPKKFLVALLAVSRLKFIAPTSDHGGYSNSATVSPPEAFRLLMDNHLKVYCVFTDSTLLHKTTRGTPTVESVVEEYRNDLFKLFRGFCSEASPNRMEEPRFHYLLGAAKMIQPKGSVDNSNSSSLSAHNSGGNEGGSKTPRTPTNAPAIALATFDSPAVSTPAPASETPQGPLVAPFPQQGFFSPLTDETVSAIFNSCKPQLSETTINFDTFVTCCCACALAANGCPWVNAPAKVSRFLGEVLLLPLKQKMHLSIQYQL